MDDASKQKLSTAYELLKRWTDIAEADSLEEWGPATIYKTSVVIWLMLFQRFNPHSSLSDAVLHFTETAPAELRTNQRLREGMLSDKTGSYSDARHRLTLKVAHWFEDRVSASIIDSTTPSFNEKQMFLVDGTTFTLAPTPAFQAAYPPAYKKRLPNRPDVVIRGKPTPVAPNPRTFKNEKSL